MKSKKLENNLEIILKMAYEYAVAGGTRGIEMESLSKATEIITKEIEKLEEYKWKHKELEK